MIRFSMFATGLFIALAMALLNIGCSADQVDYVEDTDLKASQFEGVAEIGYDSYEIGKSGGQFVISVLSDPKTLNNALSGETSTTDITRRLYAPAVKRSQLTLEWVPAVAESWEFSDDQKTITLNIRPGLKWSDGEDLDARDFVFTYNHIALRTEVETNSRDGLIVNQLPVTVTLLDNLSFSITSDTVYAGLLNISNFYPSPMHIFGPVIGWEESDGFSYDYDIIDGEVVERKNSKIDYSALNSFWGVDADVSTIVGNGPFIISEYLAGQKVVLKKNPYYYEKDAEGNQLPYLDEIVMLIAADQDTQLAKFQSGETNFFNMGRGEDYAVLIDKKEELDFEIYNVGPAVSTQFITMNQNPDATSVSPEVIYWTSNKSFRKAIAHIVDRQTIINNIAYGFGYPQYSFIPRFSPYYWEDVDDTAIKFNPEEAKRILDDLGWKDSDGDGIREDDKGNKISLRMTTNSGNRVREAIGELFAQEAGKIGIEVVFQPEDFNTMVEKLLSGNDWDIILIGLTGSVDPISGANVYPSSGNLHMIEPNQVKPRREWEKAVDEAWKVANNTLDENQRKEGWQTIQEIWVDELPWIYTFNAAIMHVYDKDLGNIKPRPIDSMNWAGIVQYLYWKS